ncbi:hypothetical protein Tco_1032541 [Tanacetum coccineum]|uniref:Uncharacterized protein n=1 Tax=Tanacetum coccineum TaxID=301880 RepID=A0ABQ5GCP4_9ASTR
MEHTYDQPQPSPVQQPASPEPQPTSPPKSPPLQGPTSTYAKATRINVALFVAPRGDRHYVQVVAGCWRTVVQVAFKRTKIYTRELSLVSRRNLMLELVLVIKSLCLLVMEDLSLVSQILVLVKSESAKEKERKYLKNNLSLKDQRKKQIREEEASLAEIARIPSSEAVK